VNTMFQDYSEPNNPLYHYTSLNGLLGIIQKRKIWATNLLFLNDSMELNYAIQLVRENISGRREKEEAGKLDEDELNFLKTFSDDLGNFGTSVHQSFDGIYVCSFSKNRDQLSQWRGYCPGGSGVSIGFDFASSLMDFVEGQGFTLVECVYDENKHREIIDDFLLDAISFFRENHHDSNNVLLVAWKVWDRFLAVAPLLKHPKFREECEWRLVSKPKSLTDVRFRAGKSMLAPYLEIKLSEDQEDTNVKSPLGCIPEICIGPTLHPSLSRISVEIMLKNEEVYKEVDVNGKIYKRKCEVIESDIPYRVQY